MIKEDNLISTLEHSLRQFQTAGKRLGERLRGVEAEMAKLEEEAEYLKVEIKALQNSAKKTEETLESLIPTLKKQN